ncbi:hypothetical protein R6Z07M_008787 [Ovis aries]
MRGGTWTPSIGDTDSYPLDHREVPGVLETPSAPKLASHSSPSVFGPHCPTLPQIWRNSKKEPSAITALLIAHVSKQTPGRSESRACTLICPQSRGRVPNPGRPADSDVGEPAAREEKVRCASGLLSTWTFEDDQKSPVPNDWKFSFHKVTSCPFLSSGNGLGWPSPSSPRAFLYRPEGAVRNPDKPGAPAPPLLKMAATSGAAPSRGGRRPLGPQPFTRKPSTPTAA